MSLRVLAPAVALGLLAGTASAQQFATAHNLNAWTPSTGGGSYAVNVYTYDDTTSENALGVTGGMTDFLWLQRYDTNTFGMSTDVIVSVDAAFGNSPGPASPPAGTPIILVVYEDQDDDGLFTSADNAAPVSQAASTLMNPDLDMKTPYAVPPAPVSNSFFVGVICPLNGTGNTFSAPMDTSQLSMGRSWASFQSGGAGSGSPPAAYPINAPTTSTFPPQDIDTISNGAGGFFNAVWLLDCQGQGPAGTNYCTAKTNSLGCMPGMSATGAPSATGAGSFNVSCAMVRNNKSGLFFYKVNGTQANVPFQGGTLCVGPQGIRRTPAQSAGGNPNPANDCSGVYMLDFNAFTVGAAGGNPAPALAVPGALVHCQAWGRDQGFPAPFNTTLSDGLEWTQGP